MNNYTYEIDDNGLISLGIKSTTDKQIDCCCLKDRHIYCFQKCSQFEVLGWSGIGENIDIELHCTGRIFKNVKKD